MIAIPTNVKASRIPHTMPAMAPLLIDTGVALAAFDVAVDALKMPADGFVVEEVAAPLELMVELLLALAVNVATGGPNVATGVSS